MRKTLFSLAFLSSTLVLTQVARAEHGETAAGAALGALTGAVIGHHSGGRHGAIVGGAFGGALGAVIANEIRRNHVRYVDHRDYRGRYDNRRPSRAITRHYHPRRHVDRRIIVHSFDNGRRRHWAPSHHRGRRDHRHYRRR